MSSKRKSTTHSSPSKRVKVESDPEELKSFFLSTIQLVTNLRDDSNRIISKEFFKLPSKKLYPDYYILIEEPISINEIKSKIVNNKYASSAQFLDDFKLMNSNAKTYNDPSSAIALDCDDILNFVQDQVTQFNGEDTRAPTLEPEENSDEDYSPELKSILNLCINYKPYKRTRISPPFMDVVDGEMYPDYYKIVKKGMSFNLLLDNISEYGHDLKKFLEDVNLIWINAQTYNDESSLLYQDSMKLCEYFYKRFAEFVEKNNVEIEYNIPAPIGSVKQETEEVQSVPEPEPQPQPEKKKRGRPRLESVVPEDPPPIVFNDEEDEDEKFLKEAESADQKVQEPALEPEPEVLSKLVQNDTNKLINYKRYVPTPHHEIFHDFIKSIAVSSTRILHKNTKLQESKIGKFVSSLEKEKPEVEKLLQSSFTEYFEFKLSRENLPSANYTLNLKNVTTVQVDTVLNMLKIAEQKFEQVLFFNGEKISSTPSIYEVEEDLGDLTEDEKLYSSRYDITLLPGLNALEFVCKVGPIILLDKNGKLPSRHATNPNNENNYTVERCCIWITVDQF